jgi:hypothetical protein
MVAGAVGSYGFEYLRSMGEPDAVASPAPAAKQAPPAPTVIVREIVREVPAKPERSREDEPFPDVEDEAEPAEASETAAEQ